MIYDLDENVLSSAAMNVAAGDDREFSALVDCFEDYGIWGETDNPGDVGLFAKANPGDSWTDIVAAPLAIGSFAPGVREFYFRVTVDATPAETDPQIIRFNVGQIAS